MLREHKLLTQNKPFAFKPVHMNSVDHFRAADIRAVPDHTVLTGCAGTGVQGLHQLAADVVNRQRKLVPLQEFWNEKANELSAFAKRMGNACLSILP